MKIIRNIIFVLIVWFVGHTLFIVIDGITDDNKVADVAVILGNKVEMDGTPSKRLKSRLDEGSRIYSEGRVKKIIVSGGIGKEGFDEAEVMSDYLIDKGIPKGDIIKDHKGNTTMLTAINTEKILRESGYDSVVVVSQYYHISRSKLAMRKQGIEKVYGSHGRIIESRDPYSIFREFFAYYKYLLK